jgi:uncharacterized protein (DUF305 family)
MTHRPIVASARFLCIPFVLAASLGASVATGQAMNHGSEAMQKSMMSGMDGMKQMKMSGDTDKDFAMMMKMHHQQALDMAKVEVEHGKSPELKAMASKMIKDQTKEIEQLDQWMMKQK